MGSNTSSLDTEGVRIPWVGPGQELPTECPWCKAKLVSATNMITPITLPSPLRRLANVCFECAPWKGQMSMMIMEPRCMSSDGVFTGTCTRVPEEFAAVIMDKAVEMDLGPYYRCGCSYISAPEEGSPRWLAGQMVCLNCGGLGLIEMDYDYRLLWILNRDPWAQRLLKECRDA